MEMPPELGKKKSSFKEEYVIAIGKKQQNITTATS